MRLIDADDFWKPFEDEKEELENRTIKTSSALTALKFIEFIKRRLDIQPTILPPEWKKGKWIVTHSNYRLRSDAWYRCNQCGDEAQYATNYCPSCGARMER